MKEQLYQKHNGEYSKIFPLNYIQNLIDSKSGNTLASILQTFNNIYIPYQGNSQDTRCLIPESLRRKGLWITYNNGEEYITEYYKGDADDIQENWAEDYNWEIVPNLKYVQDNASKLPDGIITADKLSPALLQLIQSSGKVVNMADDEDIEEVNSTLKFKDRKYNSELASGKGYKILRKNWTKVGGKMINLLTQDMINEANTIYEIRYDFDLNEKDIIIPEGCILKFNGGSFSNGIIIGNLTNIVSDRIYILRNIECQGTYNIDTAYCEWFGGGFNSDDSTEAIINTLKLKPTELILYSGTYNVSQTINFDYSDLVIRNKSELKAITNIPCIVAIDLKDVPQDDSATNVMGLHKLRYICGGGRINGNGLAKRGVAFRKALRGRLYNITIQDTTKYGLEANYLDENYAGNLYVNNCVFMNTINNKDCIAIHANRSDCEYSHIEIINYKIGVKITKGSLFSEIHGWLADVSFVQDNDYEVWKDSCLFYAEGGISVLTFNNGECDTMRYFLKISTNYTSFTGMINNPRIYTNPNVSSIDVLEIYPLTLCDGGNQENIWLSVFGGWIVYDAVPFVNMHANAINKYYFPTRDKDFGIMKNEYFPKTNKENTAIHNRLTNSGNRLCLLFKVDVSKITYFRYNFNGYLYTGKGIFDISVYCMVNSNTPKVYIKTNIPLDGDNGEYSTYIRFYHKIENNILKVYTKSEYQYNILGLNTDYDNYTKEEILNPNLEDYTEITSSAGNSVGHLMSNSGINPNLGMYQDALNKNYGKYYVDLHRNKIVFIPNDVLISDLTNTLRDAIGNSINARTIGDINQTPAIDKVINGFVYYDTTNNRILFKENDKYITSNGLEKTVKWSGTFEEKPNTSQGIKNGFSYFCIDRQTTEGATNGIMIYHKGNNIWVDALGRVVE